MIREAIVDYLYGFGFQNYINDDQCLFKKYHTERKWPNSRNTSQTVVEIMVRDGNLICSDLTGTNVLLEFTDPRFFDLLNELITTGLYTQNNH